MVTIRDIFLFKKSGIAENGAVIGSSCQQGFVRVLPNSWPYREFSCPQACSGRRRHCEKAIMALLISIITCVAIVAAASGIMLFGSQDGARQITRRLEGSALSQESYEVAASALMRDEGLSTLPWLNQVLAHWSRIGYVRALLSQAGMETKPRQILLMTAVIALGTYVFVHLFFGGVVSAILWAIGLGSMPIGMVFYRRHNRMRAFEKNFPEAIDLLARAVRWPRFEFWDGDCGQKWPSQ